MIINLGSPVPVEVKTLLAESGLPSEDMDYADWLLLLGWRSGDELIAVAGIERCGEEILLRSVVTRRDCWGEGLALKLVERLHEVALDHGYTSIFLLTTDADGYFSQRFGYRTVDRQQAPSAIVHSNQFSNLCPDDAILMRKELTERK